MPNCEGQSWAKAVPDSCDAGLQKFATSSLAMFNKKVHDMISRRAPPAESNDMPSPNFSNGGEGESEDFQEVGDSTQLQSDD